MVPVASSVTVAGASAAAPAARRVKLAVVIEAAAMGLLNVAVTVVLRGTLIAPGAGDRAITVGATSVVKLQTKFVPRGDRKSTRLNSSHSQISYAVFCLKKKKHTL